MDWPGVVKTNEALIWPSRRPAIPQGCGGRTYEQLRNEAKQRAINRPFEDAQSAAGDPGPLSDDLRILFDRKVSVTHFGRVAVVDCGRQGWCGGEELNLHVLADTSS
jgi:hypothetical protein